MGRENKRRKIQDQNKTVSESTLTDIKEQLIYILLTKTITTLHPSNKNYLFLFFHYCIHIEKTVLLFYFSFKHNPSTLHPAFLNPLDNI